MNRTIGISKRPATKGAPAPANGVKMKLSDEDRAALLARLESIERNFIGAQKMLDRLREDITGS